MNFKQGKQSSRRATILRAGILSCALAVALAASAGAALPNSGTVLTGVAKEPNGTPAYAVTVKVKSDHTIQKIMVLPLLPGKSRAAAKSCLRPANFSFKTLHVGSDGTFKDHTSGYMFKGSVEGKFKSSGKATGRITACSPGLKFTATR